MIKLPVLMALVLGWSTPLQAQCWTHAAEVPANPGTLPSVVDVDLSGDTLVVGATEFFATGTVRVFERDFGGPNAWGESAQLIAPPFNTEFGRTVAVDGDVLAVGAPTYAASSPFGRVFIYAREPGNPTQWNLQTEIPSSANSFGWGLELSGDELLIGALHQVTLHGRDQGGPDQWGEVLTLAPSPAAGGSFGGSVGLSGNIAVVGFANASGSLVGEGRVHVFERDAGGPGTWGQVAVLNSPNPEANGIFGRSVAVSDHTIVVGASAEDVGGVPEAGRGYVFERDSGGPGAWGLTASFESGHPSPVESLGFSVAADVDRIVLGMTRFQLGYNPVNLAGLAFDTGSGQLYGSDAMLMSSVISKTVRIDPATGTGLFLGETGVETVNALAFDPVNTILYGSDRATDQLVTIDRTTGQATVLGYHGFDNVAGLAFDATSRILYGSDNATDELVAIDPLTAAGSTVGLLGFGSVKGLAFDPNTGTLYGSDSASQSLISIDTATGAGTLIGSIGFDVAGLAFDVSSGQLYGLGAQVLVQIDSASGAGLALGPFNTGLAGAAFVSERTGSGWSQLVRVLDPSPGDDERFGSGVALDGDRLAVAAKEGAVQGTNASGTAHVFDLTLPISNYCTAGVSASGCQAGLSAEGIASVTYASGFTLHATGAEGAKDGLFFFGSNGRQANSWGSGSSFQCVVPPVVRSGLVTGAGTLGACDGSFTLDLNALWCVICPRPGKNPGVGAVVQAQLWYRDPQNPSNQTTSLSDAIEFCVSP